MNRKANEINDLPTPPPRQCWVCEPPVIALKTRGPHLTATKQTLEECNAFMAPIWTSERGRYGRARVPAPLIERPARGQRRALAHASHRITLPKWARNPWVILHEMAHRLTPVDEAHGPRFVGVLIGLLARHAGYRAQALMEAAEEMGVDYFVKSIGSVPVHTLSERLAQILPVSEIDAAIELDVTWRQIRGTSISLIRNRRARWLRGKLVMIAPALEVPLSQVACPST